MLQAMGRTMLDQNSGFECPASKDAHSNYSGVDVSLSMQYKRWPLEGAVRQDPTPLIAWAMSQYSLYRAKT